MIECRFTGSIEEIAEKAQEILTRAIAEGWCTAQAWDNRIDCSLKMPDGSVVGEFIAVPDVTEEHVRETAERLAKRKLGIPVELQDELRPPILIVRETRGS